MEKLVQILTKKTSFNEHVILNILRLLDEGATIPFIARYRKEMTEGASDDELRKFSEIHSLAVKLLNRKSEVLRILEQRDVLTKKLKEMIEKAETLAAIEDLYRPFKEKKNTRASQALTLGLGPLADLMEKGKFSKAELEKRAKTFVKGEVSSIENAIQGASDILAERYSDDPVERERVRSAARKIASIEIKTGKGSCENKSLYEKYDGQSEKIASIPSHRYLAIMRGTREKELALKFSIDLENIEQSIRRNRVHSGGAAADITFEAYRDGLRRLVVPSIEREMHGELKERSDFQAISTFGKNLSQLLMTPPVLGRVILGVDPAYRTGCKLAVIDENGTYLNHGVIYPTPPHSDYESSKKVVLKLARQYNIGGVAIGNGTGSRETQEFFARLNREEGAGLTYTVVSEAGASVYSASQIANDEYPELDVTIRGAISIAQRLRDPMAALVKISPESLGIGQYQHDVDQKLLKRKLHETIEDLVNKVGVDVNSASVSLLSYVAGVGPKLAKAIVTHREINGPYRSRSDIKKVKGMGTKAFEQCAGFLRIRNGKSILDNTGVHPESYQVAEKLLDTQVFARLCRKANLKEIRTITDVTTDHIEILAGILETGKETLKDIVRELQKPGFDPREELPAIPFRDDITDIKSLKSGTVVSGVVRNITDFGAFVDIGLKNDGLIHISEMSQSRISHPLEVLSVNQYLPSIRVLDVDPDKGKVSLSIKDI